MGRARALAGLAILGGVGLFTSCTGCEPAPAALDAGVEPGGGDAGDPLVDGGLPPEVDAGAPGIDGGAPVDGGAAQDAGPPFEWTDIFGDAGLPPELDCLPGTMPDVAGGGVSAVLGALELSPYSGSSENGVKCGDATCTKGVPCCVFCGWARCADPGEDGGPPTCPAFTQEFFCDGTEDCPSDPARDTCCYSLSGTTCTSEQECTLDLSFLDGGFNNPFDDDAGVTDPLDDGGASDDGGLTSDDGGGATSDDGGPASDDDAGPPVGDIVSELLDQGIPVCRSMFFDCDLLGGEMCCTSELFVAVDLGLCMPALVCVGGGI